MADANPRGSCRVCEMPDAPADASPVEAGELCDTG